MGWVTKSWTCPSTHAHTHLSSIIYLLSSVYHPSPIHPSMHLSTVFSLCYSPTLPHTLSLLPSPSHPPLPSSSPPPLLPPLPPLPSSLFSPLLPPSLCHSHKNFILFSDRFLQSDGKTATGSSHLTAFLLSNRESRKHLFLNISCKIPL